MSPRKFRQAREAKESELIYDQPYYPNLMVDTSRPETIVSTAISLLFPASTDSGVKDIDPCQLIVSEVKGGITNSLFCISGFAQYGKPYSSILLRVFGAEGMIDRDIETSTFAVLSKQNLAPPYYGRFGNGRIEGYYEGASPLSMDDLCDLVVSKDIAMSLATMHYEFSIPDSLKEYHDAGKPSLWEQLRSWMDQARKIDKYQTEEDDERAKEFYDLERIQAELLWVQEHGIPSEAEGTVAFCHNDLLAANILKREDGTISLIDFEYGGVNYVAFDIANHFNEFCGGTSEEENGVPDYNRFPSKELQETFLRSYLDVKWRHHTKGHDSSGLTHADRVQKDMVLLSQEVKAYVLVNHLYWGLWAVNQAATEGTNDFDYMEYAKNRFNRYFEEKMHIFGA